MLAVSIFVISLLPLAIEGQAERRQSHLQNLQSPPSYFGQSQGTDQIQQGPQNAFAAQGDQTRAQSQAFGQMKMASLPNSVEGLLLILQQLLFQQQQQIAAANQGMVNGFTGGGQALQFTQTLFPGDQQTPPSSLWGLLNSIGQTGSSNSLVVPFANGAPPPHNPLPPPPTPPSPATQQAPQDQSSTSASSGQPGSSANPQSF